MQSNALQRFSFSVNTWDTMVSIKEFKMKYRELESSLKLTPKLTNRKSSEPCEMDELVVNPDISVANDCCTCDDQNTIESDEFRIRKPAVAESSSNASHGNSKVSFVDNAVLLRRQIFEQTVLIFPSVFKNIAGTTEHTPYIVIRPSYFDNASDEEQFLAFTSHTGNQDSFLTLHFPSGNIAAFNWWHRISSNTDISEDSSIPLSSFLTARLEWAAWESFLEFEFNESNRAIDMQLMGAMDGVNHSRNHLLSILGDILSHGRAVNDLSLTIDSATLANFVAPLFNTCLQWDRGVDQFILNNFEDLILTPFTWILRAVEASAEVNLHDIDEAIDLSLQRMDQHKPEDHSAIVTTADAGFVDPKRTDDNAPQSKKKKKNKKKKVGVSQEIHHSAALPCLTLRFNLVQEVFEFAESKC
jgi:hypothetical protein